MRKFILLMLLLAFVGEAKSQPLEIHSKHFIKGYPIGMPASNDLIIRDLYALSSNDQTKFADWVSYRLTKETVGGQEDERDWEPDPWLSEEETLEPNDYEGAYRKLNTHRGHQAPLAALDGRDIFYQTNYLSNITPQKANLNSGSWRVLESRIREMLADDSIHKVFVMTGPLYEEEMPSLPGADEHHKIPSGYWKIVSVKNESKINTAAFIFSQDTPYSSPLLDHLVTINTVENKSGLNFFWELKEYSENKLEAGLNQEWATKYFSEN